MTWVRIDDLAPLHPKLLDAGPEAAWLWISGLAHCNRCHTDGFIASRHLAALYPGKWTLDQIEALAAQLVAVRLWHREPDGYRVHDYADFQAEATREAVDIRRQYERERKAAQRARRASPGHVPDTVPDKSRDMSHGTTAGHVPGTTSGHDAGTLPRGEPGTEGSVSQPPVPSRPVPSREEETDLGHRPAAAGTPVATATLSLLPLEEAPKAPRDIDRVFQHWQTATKHTRAVLDAKREKAIRAALKNYSVADLCRSIDGYARSPFHQGQNDSGARHDDITLIVRDATHVEAGWGLAAKHAPAARPAAPPPPRPTTAPRVTPEEVRAMRAALAPVAPKEVAQ